MDCLIHKYQFLTGKLQLWKGICFIQHYPDRAVMKQSCELMLGIPVMKSHQFVMEIEYNLLAVGI